MDVAEVEAATARTSTVLVIVVVVVVVTTAGRNVMVVLWPALRLCL